MNIFVTGTDTNIGKTVISSWICRGIGTRAQYWKPIQTGSDFDTLTVKKFAPQTRTLREIYRFKNPLSPYDASILENVNIDIDKIIEKIPERTVIEGAGGILVPICNHFQMIDLAAKLHARILIVAKAKLGFLNHIFMTAEVLKQKNLDIVGIILNGDTDSFLIETIERFSGLKVLSIFPYSDCIERTLDEFKIPSEIEAILK